MRAAGYCLASDNSRVWRQLSGLFRLTPLLILALLTGCIGTKPWLTEPPGPAVPEPIVETAPVADTPPPPVPPAAATAPTPAVTPRTPRVLVLRSSDADNYLSVSDALLRNLDNTYDVHQLSLADSADASESASPLTAQWDATIAIGLDAAHYAATEIDAPVVFCQVLDYQALLSTSDRIFGVAPMPPLAMQLRSWRTVAPTAGRVGLIVSENEQTIADEARAAAAALNIELHIAFAKTDRDAIYQFKRFAQSVDMLWLQPDSSILSPTSIREILDYANIHRVQTMVFNSALLEWGALLSVGSRTEDVAAAATDALAAVIGQGSALPQRITPLSEIDARLNEEVAVRLGILDASAAARARMLLLAADDDS